MRPQPCSIMPPTNARHSRYGLITLMVCVSIHCAGSLSLISWIGPNTPAALTKIADLKVRDQLQLLADGKKTFDKLDKKSQELLINWYKPQDAEWKQLNAEVAKLEKERPKETRTKIQVCTEGMKPMRHHVADGSILPTRSSIEHVPALCQARTARNVAMQAFLAPCLAWLFEPSPSLTTTRLPNAPEAPNHWSSFGRRNARCAGPATLAPK